MAIGDPVPNPVSDADVQAVIGLLAVLEGELLVDGVDHALARRILDRVVMAGLLPADADVAQLRRTLGEVNQRLRYGRGEYAQAPEPEGPIVHVLHLLSEARAAECLNAALALWSGAGRVEAHNGEREGWWVHVEDDALPLTARFAEHTSALEDLARRFGGRYGGCQA